MAQRILLLAGAASLAAAFELSILAGGAIVPAPVKTIGSGDIAVTGVAKAVGPPPACTSFVSLYESCAAKAGSYATARVDAAVSCLCYTNGKFTTAFDDYISTCGTWAKTAQPAEYESFVAVETFCEAVAKVGGPATATYPTKEPNTVTVTPTATATAAQNAGNSNSVARGGLAAWLAVVLPFVM
ncbi:MAG: hypothetical protein STHCBS139747_005884 [Sporothrix thermara]